MAKIEVLAGDLPKGKCPVHFDIMTVYGTPDAGWSGESVPFTAFKSAEVLDEDKVKKLAGTAGWGFVGLVALGPLGAIGGMLLGGNKKEVSFNAELDDGRKFMAITDSRTWRKIAAALFERDGTDDKSKGP